MTETSLPTYLTRPFALTKPQLATELGAELLSLCQHVTADGRLAPEEIAGLRQWLEDAEAAELQAARFLRGVIERVLADGRITTEEYLEVYRAIEAVLPFEVRQQAHAVRVHATALDRAAPAAFEPIAVVTFMVAGVRQGGRPALIEQYASAGIAVSFELAAADSREPGEIAVMLPGGAQIGVVPAVEARQFAPLLRQGCPCSATVVRIRNSGRGPLPVVQAQFFGVAIDAFDPLTLAASQPSPPTGDWRRWLALLLGLVAAALIVFAMSSR